MTPPDFGALGLSEDITSALARRGITSPFPIQSAVIPDALAGHDVCGRAPTGSGKTLAFGLPLVSSLADARPRRPTGLVLAPTRELAHQIATELQPFAAAGGHAVAAVYGGVGFGAQRHALDRGVELVVACPGRLEDLLAQQALVLDDVAVAVVDEADRMADMGFLPAVRRLLAAATSRRQTMLFSATLEGPVARLTEEFQRHPVRHQVGSTEPDLDAAHHLFWAVERAERVELTARIVSTLGSVVVFCRTKHGADRLVRQLRNHGVAGAPIHGNRSQGQRDRALAAFASGRVAALVATDVAARGIHVDHVGGVIHFDPPVDAATYVHRSGRTARAGASGTVVSLVDPGATKDAARLQRQVGLDVGIHPPDPTTLDHEPVPPKPVLTEESPGPERPRSRSRSRPGAARRGDRHGHSGTVKYFSASKGYGFIARPGAADLFVHYSNIVGDGFRSLEKGGRVEFELGEGRRGPEARNVRAIR